MISSRGRSGHWRPALVHAHYTHDPCPGSRSDRHRKSHRQLLHLVPTKSVSRPRFRRRPTSFRQRSAEERLGQRTDVRRLELVRELSRHGFCRGCAGRLQLARAPQPAPASLPPRSHRSGGSTASRLRLSASLRRSWARCCSMSPGSSADLGGAISGRTGVSAGGHVSQYPACRTRPATTGLDHRWPVRTRSLPLRRPRP